MKKFQSSWLQHCFKNGFNSKPEARFSSAFAAENLLVRSLEPRRVLSASIQSLVVPAVVVEGDMVEVSSLATGEGALQYNWSVEESGQVIATSEDATFQFTPTENGSYEIHLQVTDTFDNSQAQATETIQVENGRPTLSIRATDSADENGAPIFHGTIADPGSEDTHTVTIYWEGLASPEHKEVFTLGAGQTDFYVSHRFLDDNPTATPSDSYLVTIRVQDDEGAFDLVRHEIMIHNVAPELTDISIARAGMGSDWTLSGEIVDPGTQDTFSLDVDWGDGSAVETFTYAAGTTHFNEQHQYAAEGVHTYAIRLAITDDDGGTSVANTGVMVDNIIPVLSDVQATDIYENWYTILTGTITDAGPAGPYTLKVDWGDGSAIETFAYAAGTTSFRQQHTYLDDDPTGTSSDLYTIKVFLQDNNLNEVASEATLVVQNLPPWLSTITDKKVAEGELLNLDWTNPLALFYDVGFQDTHTVQIDWGDGSAVEAGSVLKTSDFGKISGSHTYADNGTYTARITLMDDDLGVTSRTFKVVVTNVAPTLTGLSSPIVVNEGEAFQLQDFGIGVSDVGFNNSLNTADPSNGGEVTETFTGLSIDWGDGSPLVSANAVNYVSGSVGVPTVAQLSHTAHTYADNGTYLVTVTFSDDDLGTTTETFEIKVLNVNPTLNPIHATDISASGTTTLTLTFEDPGADSFEILVDWGDKEHLPPADRFVVETVHFGTTPETFVLNHTYNGPPDPMNPAADITIRVKIRDDDFGQPGLLELGESHTETVTISNTGEGKGAFYVDTTPQVPRLVFPKIVSDDLFIAQQKSGFQGQQSTSEERVHADMRATSDRYFEIRVVHPDGTQSKGVRIKSEAMDDLAKMFQKLPDNHYIIYLVRTENNSRRLVLDIYVRNGRVIDPSDDSDGTLDRPPTEEQTPASEQKPENKTKQNKETTEDQQELHFPEMDLEKNVWTTPMEATLASRTAADWHALASRRMYIK